MKTKKLLFAATAILAFASCSEETYVGEQNPQEVNHSGAISFNMSTAAVTRGTSTDAGKLNSQFIVWGEKGETSGDAAATGNLVFKNYLVKYTANTANTTTSNTNDWEYVGISATSAENTNISPNSETEAQTIKYWDNAATSYTFTAISAKPDDISAGRVSITKTQTGTNVYAKGYSVALTKDASDKYPSLTDLYFADRINIAQGSGYSHNAVQFTFRNVLSQVRVGVYETIPGYAISEIKFYKQDGTTEYKVSETSAFGAVCPNVIANNFVGTVNVTYYADGDIQNHPKIVVTPTGEGLSKTDLVLGTNFSTLTVGDPDANPVVEAKFLGTTALVPTYDTNGGAYTSVLPQVENTTNLKLKVDYKLYNSVTKETIQITGKTAEIPSQYLQWKANFKYTYLFKITDDDLTPITFDAVVVEAENGVAEYITTVSEPSITTFGVNSSTGKYTTGGNEYAAGSNIYATFVDAGTVITPTLGTNVNVYLATTTDAAAYPITEASVAEALLEVSAIDKKITLVNKNADGSTSFTAAPTTSVEGVPSEDGKWLSTAVVVAASSVNDATGYFTDMGCTVPASLTDGYLAAGTYYQKWTKALKLTGAVATTSTTALVVEYVKTAATYNTEGSTYDSAPAFKLYSDADGTTEVTWADNGTTYYKRTSVKTRGAYAYKVIRVN